MNFVKLLTPFQQRISGTEADLIITEMGWVDAMLTVKAQVWNEEVLAADTVNLDRERTRTAFARKVTAAHPTIVPEPKALETTLLHAAVTLGPLPQGKAEVGGDAAAQSDPTGRLEELAAPLLAAPDLLHQYRRTIGALALVGEERNVLALLLAATTRVTDDPTSLVGKGPSSAGKSFLINTVLSTLPTDAYLDYTSVSPHFLSYDEAPLEHRIVVLMEAPGLGHSNTPSGEITAYVARSLISEGCIKTGTVEKSSDGGGMAARTIIRKGPAALWTTTTRARLDDELETRLLSLTIRDDLQQTRAVMGATAGRYEGHTQAPPDLAPWHAVQSIIQSLAPCAVVLPFARVLAQHTDARQVRARRDFTKLLSLVAASAILHHRQRQTDEQGRIVADVADYRHVYRLLAETFGAIAAQGCTPAVREAVAAVAAIVQEQQTPATVRQVADRLKIDRSAGQRRLDVALGQGWLVDERQGKTTKQHLLRPGEPLPEDRPAIPDPDLVAQAMPECAQAVWIDPLIADDTFIPPESDCTTAQAEADGPATRGDARSELVQPPTAQVVHKPAQEEASARLVQSCAPLVQEATAQAGKDADQRETDVPEGTCAVVQGELGGNGAIIIPTCPTCGQPLDGPYRNLGYDTRLGAYCERCDKTMWQPKEEAPPW